MTVKKIAPQYWQIVNGGRWWTACRIRPGAWNIQNEAGKYIDPDGRIGRRLIDAVQKFEAV